MLWVTFSTPRIEYVRIEETYRFSNQDHHANHPPQETSG